MLEIDFSIQVAAVFCHTFYWTNVLFHAMIFDKNNKMIRKQQNQLLPTNSKLVNRLPQLYKRLSMTQ